ncbi:tellurite resistance TerB C-terminal domain-containing protein [Phormidesmis priestleyi]
MFKSRLLLSFVALVVSFCLSLLTGRDFGRAISTGLITLFASLVGAAISERRYQRLFQQRAEELMMHIRSLQRHRAETYDELTALMEERDRLATLPPSPQTANSALPSWQPPVSWNLAAPQTQTKSPQNPAHSLQTKIQQLETQEAELNRSLAATLTAKQRAELSLTTTQAELNQTQAQILEQRNLKEQILQDILHLTAQKQQLDSDLSKLQSQLQELERYRSELNQFLSAAEPKRQQVETGSKSLQTAIEQLQLQISSLHVELSQLETQILDRRTEKETLDQEITLLQSKLNSKSSPLKPSSSRLRSAAPPDEWTQLITELPEFEFQALRAIAEQTNPNPALKKIAEANLTMPELLIDAINERALETIGDMILEPGSGSTLPTIAQEYLKIVQTLIITRIARR